MKKLIFIICHMLVINAQAFITVGTDQDCDHDISETSIQALINAGNNEIRLTNQQIINENMVVTKSIHLKGGYNTCDDAENNVVSSSKSIFNGGAVAPVFAINSPNDGSAQFITLHDLIIENGRNSGDHHGGGISIYDNNDNFIQLTLEGTIVRNNHGRKGGGIYIKGSGILANLFNTIVINNQATGNLIGTALGGGVYCHSSGFILNRNSGISFNQAFSANSLTGHGGGIYATHACDINLLGGTDGALFDFRGISYNSATGHGGGVLLAEDSSLSAESNVYNNPININNNQADSDNSGSGNGGGVFLAQSNSSINGLKLVDNQAMNGGGVYVSNNAEFSIGFSQECGSKDDCNLFSGNTVDSNEGKGGFAYVDGSELSIRYAHITNNKADLGSVIYATNDADVFARTNIIYRNGGDNDGWNDENVIYAEGGQLSLTNITMALNYAISATIKQVNGAHDIFASIIFEPITNQVSNFIGTTGYKNCLMVDNDFGIGGGTSNIFIDDPLFVDANNDDFHLLNDSPAIDMCFQPFRGGETNILDIDGQDYGSDHPDVFNGTSIFIDIGADEVPGGDLIFSDGFDPEEI